MKVFISWSGTVSNSVAVALRDWLPSVIQGLVPFLSSEDIQKGGRWFNDVGAELEATEFGILCLTPDNLDSAWLLFEAGALSKRVGQSHVAPLLLGFEPGALKLPLSSFQATVANKDDISKLLQTINSQLGEKKLSEERLAEAIAVWWPKLEAKLQDAEKALADKGHAKVPERPDSEILKEILELVRGISQGRNKRPDSLEFDWLDWLSRDATLPSNATTDDYLRLMRSRELQGQLRDLNRFTSHNKPVSELSTAAIRHALAQQLLRDDAKQTASLEEGTLPAPGKVDPE